MVPAPVWVITSTRVSPVQRYLHIGEGVRLILSVETYCRARRLPSPTQIWIQETSRPIVNLRMRARGTNPWPPDPVHRQGRFEYRIALTPSERMARPVSITAFRFRPETAKEISLLRDLPGIEHVYFCENLEVIQVTVGYKIGHPRESTQRRIMMIDYDQGIYRLPTRWIKTKGLIVKVSKGRVESALDSPDERKLWRALHTLCHAFLAPLPRISGLEAGDFGEALSMPYYEFAVFDNSPGGLGGIEGIVGIGEAGLARLHPNYEFAVANSWNCPLRCIKACIACLYTDSCYMLNWNLDRNILLRLGWGAMV